MISADSQHSSECWLLAIPKTFAPIAPKFPLGLPVKLPARYQLDPGQITYGQIIGIEWYSALAEWRYIVEAPEDHPWVDDLLTLDDGQIERLIEQPSTPSDLASA